jgi:acyl carrier protein
MDFLADSADIAGVSAPSNGDDLFKTGVLDSFALVDFVAMLELNCNIKVADSDVVAANFQTVEAIEKYVQAHQA